MYIDNWAKITKDTTILSWIKAYTIPFITTPVQNNCPTMHSKSLSESLDFEKSIKKLLNIGAIRKCIHDNNEFLSHIFLVPKPNGDKRFILNLKNLNKFIKPTHFKMEDYRTASKLITPNCFMASIDLKDAYFLISVAESQRKYLRFQYNNRLYEFNCLPFGLCTAPYVFTKLLKPVMEYLRNQNMLSVIFLDDILCFGQTYDECVTNVNNTITLLKTLGFIINTGKEFFDPKTTM